MKVNAKLVRFIILIIALVMVFSGCGKVDGTTLSVDGKQVNVPYVVKIDGKKISLDEYRYYFLNLKKKYDGGDETVWKKKNTLEMLKLDVLDGIKESNAVWSLADSNGVKLSKEDKKSIEDNISKQIETYGGEEKYNQTLKDNYMTEDFYNYMWETSILYEKLNEFYFGESGQYHSDNANAQETADQMKELVNAEKENLKVEFGPEYDLITTETLK